MKTFILAGLGGFITLGIICFALIAIVVGILNTEIALREKFEAQEEVIATAHDNMWKTISDKYNVNETYRQTFLEGLSRLADGRKGGSLFKSSSEAQSQLGLPTATFTELMATVEGKRDNFMRQQNILVDIWKEHKVHCTTVPNRWLIGAKVMIKPQLITSDRTQEAIESKVDNFTLGE